MQNNDFFSKVQENPIIAAVNNVNNLDLAIESPCQVIFLLKGDIFNLQSIVDRVKSKGKSIFIHVDLMDGFSKDQISLKYIKDNFSPHGIITTRSNIAKIAKDMDLFVIQRIFLLDSLSFETGLKTIKSVNPDVLEILPGVLNKVIGKMSTKTKIPIIASGLITDKEDVVSCIKVGAIAISSTNKDVWYL